MHQNLANNKIENQKSLIKTQKVGPFVTQLVEQRKPDDLRLHTSRRLRKGLIALACDECGKAIELQQIKPFAIIIFKPKSFSWWIAIFFMLGSSCFAAASILNLYFENVFSVITINATYFIGSIFFTSAAYCQYMESINADITNTSHLATQQRSLCWWAWRPHNLGFLASFTQLLGTLFFNINTFDGMLTGLTTKQTDILIWTPNMLGSICFILAAFFAWLEIYKDKHLYNFRSFTWWIVWVNIAGSIFFQLSAFLSFIPFETGHAISASLATELTLLGAVCFFIAAYLLLPEIQTQ